MSKAPVLPQLRDQQVLSALREDQRRALAQGQHFDVAAQLVNDGDLASAAWVYEQIWSYHEAVTYYLQAARYGDSLRVALLDTAGHEIDRVVQAILADTELKPHQRSLFGQWLLAKRRPEAAANILESTSTPTGQSLATAYVAQGDILKAAETLASAGDFSQAQSMLREQVERTQDKGRVYEHLAQLSWQLGEDEEAVSCAQQAFRRGYSTPALLQVAAASLRNLDHPIASRLILDADQPQLESAREVHQRFRVIRSIPALLCGESYLAHDRSTHAEVELHLLFADLRDADFAGITDTVEKFCEVANLAASLGHPGILPMLELNSATGLMVTPRYSGRTLRHDIRDLPRRTDDEHRQAMFLFLAEALAAAHSRGIVHGSLLASQMYLDALDRPLLGPFGAHLLAGLAATRTGSLEEIMGVMAPEARRGAAPTFASDMYSLGALGYAMSTGYYPKTLSEAEGDPFAATGTLGPILRELLAVDPAQRPEIDDCIRELRSHGPSRRVWRKPRYRLRDAEQEVGPQHAALLLPFRSVIIDTSWGLGSIDTLLAHDSPAVQTIIGHTESRTLQVLAWPQHLGERSWNDLTQPQQESLLTRWRHELGDATVGELLRRAKAIRLREACAGDLLLDLESVLTSVED